MPDKCDVVVIGGGPAGLTSAWKLAESGLKVILIETKKTAYRYKRPCCAMVILEPEFHGELVATQKGSIIFRKNDFSIPYEGEFNDLNRSVKFSPSGYKFLVSKKSGYPLARTINKEALLKTLYHNGLDAGVEMREGETAVNIENMKDGVEVIVRRNGKLYSVNASYAVAADGVNSTMIAALGLNLGRKHLYQTRVIGYEFEDVDSPFSDSFMQFKGKVYGASGAITVTPKPLWEEGKLVYEVSIGPDSKKGETAEGLLKNFLSREFVAPWFKRARLSATIGCMWHLYEPLSNPVCDRVVLAGDGPSFQEVENQGAMMCGYKASEAIKAEMEGKSGFDEYRQFWQKSFEFNDPKVLYETARGFGLRNFGDEELDFLFSMVDDEVLDGTINHFKVGNTMLAEFEKRLDYIKKKRPDIAEKLSKFINPEQKIEKFFW